MTQGTAFIDNNYNDLLKEIYNSREQTRARYDIYLLQ